MSDLTLISPLLDGYIMGDPISDHHGIRCCPAMTKDTEDKFIVKVIAIPASQVQLEALLLSGAYSSKDSALQYFSELAEDIHQEAAVLQKLSKLEGFVPFDAWQTVPMEDGTGYLVYLLSPYRAALERYMNRNPMTQLDAVNLGLDLCTAMTACRRSGYLYVDLKPGNIFITNNSEYRVGDLGFIRLSSLKYASLPDKYRSAYTPPEITDAYSALNDTLDIYAIGMILYQIYNGGTLPQLHENASEQMTPPAYADYEMAEIILKACALKPEDRWQDPAQMGQAIVSYMQKNGIHNTPIIPQPETEENPQPEEEIPAPELSGASTPESELAEPVAEESADEPSDETPDEVSADEENISEEESEVQPEESETKTQSEEAAFDAEETDNVPVIDPDFELAEIADVPENIEPPAEQEEEYEQDILAEFLDTPDEDSLAILDSDDLSEDTSEILAQADELIAHTPPEPVVQPEPIEVPIPPRITPTPSIPEIPESIPQESQEVSSSTPEAPETQEVLKKAVTTPVIKERAPTLPKKKKRHTGLIVALVLLLLLGAGFLGGRYYYENYYLQTIRGIVLRGTENQLSVSLDTQTDNSLLTVICTDTYGNAMRIIPQNNVAVFSSLRPSTTYRISVEISGFHQLIGNTTGSYTTATQTSISSFNAVTGAEDGSVILNFTVQGPEASAWRVRYWAEGVEEKTMDFSGHMVTINGLSVGKEYTFKLEPVTTLYVIGNDTVTYTASKIIYAQNLKTNGFHNGSLTATWSAPEGITVTSWTVRCYNTADFDSTITVTEPEAIFLGLDPALAYTIEVVAAGMTQGSRTFISANSITFKDIQVDASNRNQLSVTWNFEGAPPNDGWLLLYTADGNEPQVIPCAENKAVISPLIPGAHYEITIQPPAGTTVFGGSYTYDAPAAPLFSGYMLTAQDMVFSMCKTPEKEDWDRTDVKPSDYTNQFLLGEKASFVIQLNHEYNTSNDQIPILFVIRDAKEVPIITSTVTRTWTYMWYRGFGEMDIPVMPQDAGSYTVEIYFNGSFVSSQTFVISQPQ